MGLQHKACHRHHSPTRKYGENESTLRSIMGTRTGVLATTSSLLRLRTSLVWRMCELFAELLNVPRSRTKL